MKNLLKETIKFLKENNKDISDVKFVTNMFSYMNCKVFTKCAEYFDYEEKCIFPKVNSKLMVVGDNWWLERYNNKENCLSGWVFKTEGKIPLKPKYRNDFNLSNEWKKNYFHPIVFRGDWEDVECNE